MKTASFDDFIDEKIKDFCAELSGARICINNGKTCFYCIRAKYDPLINTIHFTHSDGVHAIKSNEKFTFEKVPQQFFM